MYRTDRLNAMVAYLEQHQILGVEEAMRAFSVSSATVRRDFARLIAARLALRGPNEVRRLTTPPGQGIDQPFSERKMTMSREKMAIARHAASFLRNRDVVFIDGGTTTACMTGHFGSRELHVITTCIQIANSLNDMRQDNASLQIVMPGGIVMPRSNVLYGTHTVENLGLYSARWAFIGVDGTDGVSLFSVNEFISSTQKAMIANSDRTVLLMDHTKYNRPSMVRTADLDERFIIVTNAHDSLGSMIDKVRKTGAEIVCVEV